ncbi:MAG TPA: outer membrane lipoprotein carrier protein LolA [Bryobacteraceae bacterium]|jgi:outer membrane lipoprotein-sorting protein|nr:outer membrane lipoprotein carrier protein LolA [Bryobacteraceae bacterium]
MTGNRRGFPNVLTCNMFCSLLFAALLTAAPDNLEALLARMDQNAAAFKSMSAKLRHVSYVDVIKESDVKTGTIGMKRARKEVLVLVQFTAPDPKSVAVSGTRIEVYLPNMKTVEVYDFGKSVEKYLALGFGASGKELKADYGIRELGSDTVNGQKTTRLELIPKAKEVLQQFPKIELWVSDATAYPVQQKLYQTGGDYMLVTYSDVVINPSLPDSAFKLSLPRDVKRVSPGK